jgi:hypothetical protein
MTLLAIGDGTIYNVQYHANTATPHDEGRLAAMISGVIRVSCSFLAVCPFDFNSKKVIELIELYFTPVYKRLLFSYLVIVVHITHLCKRDYCSLTYSHCFIQQGFPISS